MHVTLELTIWFFLFQYEGQGENYTKALDYMNMIFTGVFALEFILKLAAFRFKVSYDLDWLLGFLQSIGVYKICLAH